jgi:hypothetical protein
MSLLTSPSVTFKQMKVLKIAQLAKNARLKTKNSVNRFVIRAIKICE